MSREIPKDLAAEQALVIGMMQGKELPDISPEDFYDGRYREIWKAGLAAKADGKDTALVILKDYIDRKIVSVSELASVDDGTFAVGDMSVYAKCVKGCAAQRQALRIVDEAMNLITRKPGKYTAALDHMIDASKKAIKTFGQGRVLNVAGEIRNYVDDQTGLITNAQVYQELNFTTKDEKEYARKVLGRLVDEGFIERVKNRSATYRKVESGLERIDISIEDDEEIDLWLPFQIHKLFVPRPKNVLLFAGEPDSGKSGAMLNLCRMNFDQHQIDYYSSEMGRNELRSRLHQFEQLDLGYEERCTMQEWIEKVNFYERSEDFHDVIKPNGISIIDYLEVHEDFWAVGGMIKKIWEKLDKGIAIICLQKTKKGGDSVGLGGLRSLEKPRLYVNMMNGDYYHTAKIIKCKGWRDPTFNPNGLEIDYKIVRGCMFHLLNPSASGKYWHRPGDKEPGYPGEDGRRYFT